MVYQKQARELMNYIILTERNRQSLLNVLSEVSKGEMAVLMYLMNEEDGVCASVISRFFKINTSRVAAILNSLSKKGMVQRQADSNDKRKIHIYLTEEGQAYTKQKVEILLSYMSEVLRYLGENDAREYIRIMKKCLIFKETYRGNTMNKYYLGIDVGSTTIKTYLTDENNHCLFSNYVRHNSDVRNTILSSLKEIFKKYQDMHLYPVMTGSGGLSLAESLNIQFVQEVIACTKTIETYIPQTDVAIELGGEDAKITYFEGTLEQRMNGTCAGGTGAFIDQMATLLQTDASGLNELAKKYQRIYPIASRCGVFAKTDIQPLINEGAKKEDIAVSIFQAVVNQTISGLACGKPIRGKIAFLGGPLYFLDELRQRFIETLHLKQEDVIFPDNSQLFVAMGACLSAKEVKESLSLKTLIQELEDLKEQTQESRHTLEPLFHNEEELEEFRQRHYKAKTPKRDLKTYQGDVYLGIDVGSTTSKVILLDNESYSFFIHSIILMKEIR